MDPSAQQLLRTLPDEAGLALAAHRLRRWLLEGESAFPESRARALLRVSEAVDDPTLGDFARLVEAGPAARLAFHDLLRDSGLAGDAEATAVVLAAAAASAEATESIAWLSLVIAAFAWKRGYPPGALDPAAPPARHSPAGRVVGTAGAFIRAQVARAPAERERLARGLAFRGEAPADAGDLGPTPMVPDPSIYRPPVPVRYAEVTGETIAVDVDDAAEPTPVRRGDPLVITEEDVREANEAPLRVEAPPPPSPIPPGAVVMPGTEQGNRPGLTVTTRRRRSRRGGLTTRLRVVVQEYADGPGMYGIQVHVRSRAAGVKVAGTTNREGHFLCQIPVRADEGVTYDVEVSWPRDSGSRSEKKAVTLNPDRTEFVLPFYPQYRPDDAGNAAASRDG